MPLSDIINVSISTATAAVTQEGFGIPLVLTPVDRKNDGKLVHYYTDLAGMASDGFLVTDKAYLAAEAIFSQIPRVQQIAVGALKTASQALVVDVDFTVANSTVYTLQIGPTTTDVVTYTSDNTATKAEIANGLLGDSHMAALQTEYGFTASVNGSSHLLFTFSGGAWTEIVPVTSNCLPSYTGSAGGSAAMQTDLLNIAAENNDWYCVVPTSPFQNEQTGVAIYAEANAKLAGLLSSEIAFATALKTAAYARSAVIFAEEKNLLDMRNAAWAGKCLPFDPGSETWKFKTLATVTPSILTPTQIANLKAAHMNYYYSLGGVSITAEGVVAAGEYIDVVRGRDWFTARLQERIYSRLVNNKKIPYTDAGIAVIEAEVRGQIRDSIAVGFLSNSPAPTVTVPLVANVSSGDKASRTLNNVFFTATLAGALHIISIQGVISV